MSLQWRTVPTVLTFPLDYVNHTAAVNCAVYNACVALPHFVGAYTRLRRSTLCKMCTSIQRQW